jgi:hypothetical protein
MAIFAPKESREDARISSSSLPLSQNNPCNGVWSETHWAVSAQCALDQGCAKGGGVS